MCQKEYTKEKLEYLITCPKEIVKPHRKDMALIDWNYRNNMDLCSEDGEERFHVFMRKHMKFEENFSIGIDHIPSKGGSQICLMRCNGPHGGHANDFFSYPHHAKCHIHKATAENITAGLRPERFAKITTEYATYDEALFFFLKRCNIKGSERYFPRHKINPLFAE